MTDKALVERSKPKSVLLTGARAPFTLGLARHLNDHGHRVVVADSLKFPITRFSRAAAAFYSIPPPVTQFEPFVQALTAIIQRERIDVLIPTCEEIFYIARARQTLTSCCSVFADTLETLATLHNKWTFNQEAARIGLPVPQTWLLQAPEEAVAAFERGMPLVFKPAYSRFAAHVLIRPHDRKEVAKLPIGSGLAANRSPSASRMGPWVAQRFVEGREVYTYSVAHAGTLTAHAAYTSTYRQGPGPCIAGVVIDHPACLVWVQRFVRAMGFTGQIAFDFIEEPDGIVQAIECNPRATSGITVFDAAEDLPSAFFSAEQPVRFPQAGRRTRGSGVMLEAGARSLASRAAFRAWWRVFKSSRDIILRLDDPLPALAEGFTNGFFIWRSFRYRMSVMEAATFDIEWNADTGATSA